MVRRVRPASHSSGSGGRKTPSRVSPVSTRFTVTARAAQPSLIGAEKCTYTRSRLTGNSAAVGYIATTSVVDATSGDGRTISQISARSVSPVDSTSRE